MQLLSHHITKKVLIKIVTAFTIILLPVVMLLGFFLLFNGRIYPNVHIAGVNVGGMRTEEATNASLQSFTLPHLITLKTQGSAETHVIPVKAIDVKVDHASTVQNTYQLGRSGELFKDFLTIVETIIEGARFEPMVSFNNELLRDQLSAYAESITTRPVLPVVTLSDGQIVVSKGEVGTEIDIDNLESQIVRQIVEGNSQPITVQVVQVDNTINDEQVLSAKLRAQKLVDKKISLTFEDQTFNFENAQLLSFIDPASAYYEDVIAKEVENIAMKVNREAQNPVFTFTDGKVQEFKPAKDGIEVNEEKLVMMIVDSLDDIENENATEITYAIPVSATQPAISMESVNDMGIKELIGRGTSKFKGSTPSRIYNIQLAASRLNGVLIKPGEEFSFNGALGDVSALTGYKQAYVIQGGKTVLGDGGGVCQVSTTFFRSALQAGLPVLERNPHSYRVGYYEQDSGPGLDASIYTPTLDLKIKNDTPGHILIQTIVDTTNSSLVFELYGTSDGRIATIGRPIVTSQSAPPEPLYIDDPTLPTGQVNQIDYAAWGAKAQFDYKVERNGEVLIERTFFSNYRPWQAKYLRGTGPAV